MKKMSTSNLIIHFIKDIKRQSYYDNIRFLNNKYDINNKDLTIDIDEKYFNWSKEKITLDLEISPVDILSEPIKYKINIFYGINYSYCFLNVDNKFLIEYNYIDDQQIFYNNLQLNKNDGNGLVKRIVLINAPHFLKISNINLTFYNSTILNFLKNYNSFEIVDLDYSESLFGVKPIKSEEKFSLISDMKKQKQSLEKFFLNLKALIENNISEKEEYMKLYRNFEIDEVILNFSQKKEILEKEFKDNEDYYLIFLYFLWYSIKYSYLNEKFECKISISDIFNNIYSLYNLYLNDKELQIYEKILCFFSHVSFFLDKNDIEVYKSANLKCIKRKDIMNYSIYKFSLDFLKDFISKLNENSYLFFPLLILDCGTYYYNVDNKSIYGFNRESCSVIKEHLNELIPDIFFEYSEEGKSGEEESGFNYKDFKMVFINRHFTFKNLKKDPIKDEYKNEDEKRLFKHYGMLASKTLMHESFGHNKRIFNKKERIISPLRFFNRNKRFVKMVPLLLI